MVAVLIFLIMTISKGNLGQGEPGIRSLGSVLLWGCLSGPQSPRL